MIYKLHTMPNTFLWLHSTHSHNFRTNVKSRLESWNWRLFACDLIQNQWFSQLFLYHKMKKTVFFFFQRPINLIWLFRCCFFFIYHPSKYFNTLCLTAIINENTSAKNKIHSLYRISKKKYFHFLFAWLYLYVFVDSISILAGEIFQTYINPEAVLFVESTTVWLLKR